MTIHSKWREIQIWTGTHINHAHYTGISRGQIKSINDYDNTNVIVQYIIIDNLYNMQNLLIINIIIRKQNTNYTGVRDHLKTMENYKQTQGIGEHLTTNYT